MQTTTTAVNPLVTSLVAACVTACAARIEAEGRKGAALTAAHAVLDAGNTFQAVHTEAARVREESGGKAAPKHIQAGYKLAKRFATVAEFCEKQGLSFKAIGETIGDKKTFSINVAEKASRSDSDNESVKAYALAFQASKGESLIARVGKAEEAEKAALNEENARSLNAARDAMRAQIMAELKAEAEAAKVQAEAEAEAAKVQAEAEAAKPKGKKQAA